VESPAAEPPAVEPSVPEDITYVLELPAPPSASPEEMAAATEPVVQAETPAEEPVSVHAVETVSIPEAPAATEMSVAAEEAEPATAAVPPPGEDAPKTRPRRTRRKPAAAAPEETPAAPPAVTEEQAVPVGTSTPPVSRDGVEPAAVPKAGIEILAVEERDGERAYRMRDLRSGRIADNITRKSARRLWRQAILDSENGPPAADAIRWEGDLGYWGSTDRDGVRRYNLAMRENSTIRYFYAVGDEGINEAWRHLVGADS